MGFLVVLAVLLAVVLLVAAPLRRGAGGDPAAESHRDDLQMRIANLEAAQEAKYRELRDAELDHRTGKLSDQDYAAIDSGLRAEVVEILRALDDARDLQLEP